MGAETWCRGRQWGGEGKGPLNPCPVQLTVLPAAFFVMREEIQGALELSLCSWESSWLGRTGRFLLIQLQALRLLFKKAHGEHVRTGKSKLTQLPVQIHPGSKTLTSLPPVFPLKTYLKSEWQGFQYWKRQNESKPN